MKSKFVCMAALLLLGGAWTSACGRMVPVSGDPKSIRATQAAVTLTVLADDLSMDAATQSALETEVSQLRTQVAVDTPAGELPVTGTSVAFTETPTSQPTITQTPVLPTATPTATSLPCNMAMFVADITIPDATVIAPGAGFTKTWRLQNLGSCAWTADYALIYVNGDALNGPAGVALPGTVLPGQIIDLSVNLIAPFEAGGYRGYWKLRDGKGIQFGLGPKGTPFYVDIKVETTGNQSPLDFVTVYCQAAWTSAAGDLSCPGDANDSRGSILRVEKPTLENGVIQDAPALLTIPQMITDGVIRGKYPSVQVGPNDHFAVITGCAYRADACDVIYQLDYQISDGTIQNLSAWHEVYDGHFTTVDIDLSRLAGQEVNFILTVLTNGSTTQQRALWIAPRIVRN
jgi:hypothetical protein